MMKKSVLMFSMVLIFLLGSLNVVVGQDQPKPKKDTVNMDTDAKPQFYYPTEDSKSEKSSSATIAIVAGAVILIGGAAFFVLKKKK